MATDRTLRVRGALRAMVSVGSTLLLATEHEEGHAMALWRVDVDSGKLDAAPLPAGATDILLDGEAAFVAGTDGHVHAGKALTGPLKALGGPLSPPPSKLVSLHDGRLAALCGASLRILRKDSGAVLQELELPEPGSAMVSDPSGVFLVVGTSRGTVLVFDCEDKAEYLQGESAKLHEGEITALCFEAGDQRFMSTGVDRRLLTTHVRGKLEPEDRGGGGMHDKTARAIVYGPESQGEELRFYTAGDDGVLKAWPAGATRKRPTTMKDGVPRGLALAFVDYKERPHIAVAMDNGARLFPVDAGGKVGDHVITYRGALDHARQELAATEPTRRQAALRQLAEDNDQASIDLIAGQAGSDADHALRLEAARLLGASGNRRAHGHLEKLLRSRDEKVRMAALEGLRALDGQADLGPLESALGTRHADIGVAAVQALAALAKSDDRAYTRLVRAMDDDPAQVRNEALSQLEGLHEAGDPEASLAGLRSGKADLRRRALLRFFQRGLLEHPATQVALRRHAEDKDADVRQAAFQVAVLSRPQLAAALRYHDKDLHRRLHELETWDQAEPPKLPRTKRVEREELSDADLSPLLQAMASRALDTCLRGASGLADLKDPRAFGALLQLSRESDEGARVAACKALAALGEPRALGRLRMMLRDPASAARDAAFSALASLLEKQPLDAAEAGLLTEHADVRRRGLQVLVKDLRAALPADPEHRAYALLRRALDDADSSVRSEAFKGALNLGVMGGAAGTLRFVLSSLHVDVRREVLNEVMAQMEADWSWALLLEMLADPDRGLRREAFDFAVKKSRGRALEPLEVALKGKHADLRVEATRQLTKKRLDDARELLIAALDDAEEEVRSLALNALVNANDDDAVRAAMRSAHSDVRVRAATARSLHGDPAALGPLMDLIAEPEPTEGSNDTWKKQVKFAVNGLSNLGDEASLDAVAALLDSKHAELRKAACDALARISRPGRTELLREALRHDDAEVRKAAAFGLAFNGDPAGATLIFAPAPAPSRRNNRRSYGSSSSAVDHKPFMAALGLGKLAREALLALLDQDDFKARGPALAAVLLLEHSGGGAAPSMLMAALSAGNADSRLIGASGLQEFPNADDYEAFVVRTLNERPPGQKAWEVPAEVWTGVAAFLSSSNPQ
ncbi:MAG: HEAT repeat domain-containing protein, partial [Alphaproteobacteria bacterium]|nr:HEAT repeat domain-containing protein [Alphaproteobacteria bacterium]